MWRKCIWSTWNCLTRVLERFPPPPHKYQLCWTWTKQRTKCRDGTSPGGQPGLLDKVNLPTDMAPPPPPLQPLTVLPHLQCSNTAPNDLALVPSFQTVTVSWWFSLQRHILPSRGQLVVWISSSIITHFLPFVFRGSSASDDDILDGKRVVSGSRASTRHQRGHLKSRDRSRESTRSCGSVASNDAACRVHPRVHSDGHQSGGAASHHQVVHSTAGGGGYPSDTQQYVMNRYVPQLVWWAHLCLVFAKIWKRGPKKWVMFLSQNKLVKRRSKTAFLASVWAGRKTGCVSVSSLGLLLNTKTHWFPHISFGFNSSWKTRRISIILRQFAHLIFSVNISGKHDFRAVNISCVCHDRMSSLRVFNA